MNAMFFSRIHFSLDGLPSTFVPGRNILFLTLAAIFAYQLQAEAVITGVCETDFSGYPDCRDEFVKALNHAVSLGIARDIRFETPLMWLNKAETWALDIFLMNLYSGKTVVDLMRSIAKLEVTSSSPGTAFTSRL